MAVSENWASLWEALAARQPDHVAVVIGDTHIRWRDLDERAARFAAALAAAGVGLDGKVAQLMYNCPEYLESAYAAFKLRGTTVNVNFRYRVPEIVHVVGTSGSTALVYHGSFAALVDEARGSLPALTLLVQVDDGSNTPLVEGAVAYEKLLAEFEPMAPVPRRGDDTLMLFTGGTTGLPKGVVWTHASLFAALASIGYSTMGIGVPETADDVARVAAELTASGRSPVNMTAPPLMHGTGLFLAFSTFVMGGTVVLLAGRSFDPAELLGLVQRERVTQLSLVGDAFAKPIVAELARAEAAGIPYDISSLGRIVSAGATFSAQSKRGLMARGPRMMIVDAIGASEGGPFAMSVTMPGQEPQETASFTATPATVLFDDATWEPIGRGSGRAGVLAASGPMPNGYYQDPDKTAATFREIDGVRYTVPGDYAIIDVDGTVHLLGRGSVCINTGGEKVYPEEVEVAAASHPAVADCLAVGVPDERMGESVALVAAVTPGRSVAADELKEHVRTCIASYKAPRHVVFVERIERSPSGKPDYRWAKQIATAACV